MLHPARFGPQLELTDLDAVSLGVERGEGGELGQRPSGRAHVLPLLPGALRRLVAFGRLVGRGAQERVELHPGFREGVVGKERGVGEHVQRIRLAQVADEASQHPPIATQVGQLDLRVAHQGRVTLELLDAAPRLLPLPLVGPNLPSEVLEGRGEARDEALLGGGPGRERGPGLGGDPRAEASQEARRQRGAVLAHVAEEATGELASAGLGEHEAHLAGDRSRSVVVSRPTIHAPRRELPLQHRHGAQVHPGRGHRAVDHLGRVGVEVEIVGLAGGQREDERVAGLATRAADSLEVAGHARGHAAQQGRRQIADVDAHLERRGRDQQVRRLWVAGRGSGEEAALECRPGVAVEQAGVLLGEDTVGRAAAVHTGVEPALGLRRPEGVP